MNAFAIGGFLGLFNKMEDQPYKADHYKCDGKGEIGCFNDQWKFSGKDYKCYTEKRKSLKTTSVMVAENACQLSCHGKKILYYFLIDY